MDKVLEDLKDFLPYLVLVGGWVPFLYSKYLWKIRQEPVQTVDIDFGFQDVDYKGGVTVAARVRQKKYGEHHAKMDRLNPFVPVVQLEKWNLKADVEFIAAPETSDRIRKRLVGEEIKVNTIEDFHLLLQSPITIVTNNIQVQVPKPSVFTFHKLLTFSARGNSDKRLKDLYYAYYMLFFSPEEGRLSKDIANLIKNLKQGKRVRENIEKHFVDAEDKGPAWIEEITRGSAMETLVHDVRQDAFERISRLVIP